MTPIHSTQSETNYQVKLVHATKPSTSEETVQLAFSINENGYEQIVTAEVDSQTLFEIAQENKWLQSSGSRINKLRRMSAA